VRGDLCGESLPKLALDDSRYLREGKVYAYPSNPDSFAAPGQARSRLTRRFESANVCRSLSSDPLGGWVIAMARVDGVVGIDLTKSVCQSDIDLAEGIVV